MRKGVANIMLLALVLFGFSKIATADVCFLPDDEECGNDVPYNEGCVNGNCDPTPPTPTPPCVGSDCDPTPPVTCPEGCFDTEAAAISARGRSKTVAGTTFIEDSYYKFNQCWCLTTECSNLEYKYSSELGGNWTCTPCPKPKSKFYNNRYKCSCNITAKNGYTANTTSCQWIPIPCEEGSSTDCTPTVDGCTTCEDTGKKSGENSCMIKHIADPTCPEGGSLNRPTSGCYNKETQKCGTQTCYIPYNPNCTGNKEQKGTADQCSCVCKTGYHEQGSDCIENACPTNTVKESDCVITNHRKFYQTSSYIDTSGSTVNCGNCTCTPLENETQPNSGCYKQAQDDNGCGEMRIVYLDATPRCGSNAHLTGSGTNCGCACDTGYTMTNKICVLNTCPTGTIEKKDCDTANTHYAFTQTGSYVNTSGNTVKCGTCTCTPTPNATLTHDNNCYKATTESDGCGGQRTVYIQYTHTCMVHGHRTGSGTSCGCACDTGYHQDGDLCVLNTCPTSTVEEATCTANAYPNTVFTQTGSYINTSGNTIKCGTCECNPTTYTLPQDSYCYQTVPANNGCGGTTTGYQKITPYCGNNTKVIRRDTISGSSNCVCECADGFDSLSAGDTHCYTNQECSLSCQATMYKVTPKNPVDDGYKIYNSACCHLSSCDGYNLTSRPSSDSSTYDSCNKRCGEGYVYKCKTGYTDGNYNEVGCCKYNTCSGYTLTTKPSSASTTYETCAKGCGSASVYKCASNYHYNSSNNKCEPDCEVRICTNPVTVPSNAHCTNECTPQTKQCVTSSTVCMEWACNTDYVPYMGGCCKPATCSGYDWNTTPNSDGSTFDACPKGCGQGTVYKCKTDYVKYDGGCCKLNSCPATYTLTTQPTSASNTYVSCPRSCGLNPVYKCKTGYTWNSGTKKCEAEEPDCEADEQAFDGICYRVTEVLKNGQVTGNGFGFSLPSDDVYYPEVDETSGGRICFKVVSSEAVDYDRNVSVDITWRGTSDFEHKNEPCILGYNSSATQEPSMANYMCSPEVLSQVGYYATGSCSQANDYYGSYNSCTVPKIKNLCLNSGATIISLDTLNYSEWSTSSVVTISAGNTSGQGCVTRQTTCAYDLQGTVTDVYNN